MATKRAAAKQAKEMEFLLNMLAEQGHTVAEEEVKKALEPPIIKKDYTTLQAEGVLLHLQNYNRTMLHKYCSRCGEVFSTRYTSVAYCSDLCRKKAMEEIGILWDPRNDSYLNMEAERPIVVGAQAHAVILKAAQRFLADQNILVKEDQTNQVQDNPLPEVEFSFESPIESPNLDAPDTNPVVLPQPSSDPSLDFLENPVQF